VEQVWRTFRFAPRQARLLPAGIVLGLLTLVLLPPVRGHARLTASVLGAGFILMLWSAFLFARAARDGRAFTLDVAFRKQHYVQACAQLSVLLYWGWYWREVYQAAPLIVAQLLFAFAFDMLLTWTRRDKYILGFGPFPVIFSINLFLWFKPDWFYLQFAMVALGFAAKELIRWERDGRSTHIFNPSSFPLGVAAIILLITHTTHITWGAEIAETQFRPPYIYWWIFLIGLPGQFFFGVTSMTLSAVATMYGIGLIYLAVTGTYFFFETIPISVFLGMHLLFTDPSTAPKTESGRVIFGMLYASAVVALAPAFGFYDKLLPVLFLNLTVRFIDRVARSAAAREIDPLAFISRFTPRPRHLAYMSVWALIFVTLMSTNQLGHASQGYYLPFWQEACHDGRRNACNKLGELEQTYCRDGESGWACNDLGLLIADGRVGDRSKAESTFRRACDLGFVTGCENMRLVSAGLDQLQQAPPGLSDFPVLLVQGTERRDESPFSLYGRACDQGWMTACERLGLAYLEGQGAPHDPQQAATLFEKACAGAVPTACASLGYQFRQGIGVLADQVRSIKYLKKACGLDMAAACRWLSEACHESGQAHANVPASACE